MTALFVLATGLSAQSFSDLAAQADAARDADRLDEAAGLYRKALALRPSWVEGWWYLGTVLYDRDQYPDAAAALRKALALQPRSANALAMLGLSEAKTGEDGSALTHLDKALAIGVDANLAHVALYTRGTLLLKTGDFAKAQDTLGRLAREVPEQQELVVALGESVLGMRPGDLASSEAEAQRVVTDAGRAEYLAARREITAAFEAYTKLAAAYPKFHNVQFALGRFLLANHEDEKAVAAFRRELENSPQHLLARLGIAGTLLASDPAAGLPYAQEAVQMAPKLAEAHYLLGALWLATREVNKAIPELETARVLDPNDARVYFRLERAYTLAKRPQDAARARSEFKRLDKTAPE